MCITSYRLGPWRSYRHETGIIRTSRTWGCATWGKFSWKVTSGQITQQKYYATNPFVWQNFIVYIFAFILNGSLLVDNNTHIVYTRFILIDSYQTFILLKSAKKLNQWVITNGQKNLLITWHIVGTWTLHLQHTILTTYGYKNLYELNSKKIKTNFKTDEFQ